MPDTAHVRIDGNIATLTAKEDGSWHWVINLGTGLESAVSSSLSQAYLDMRAAVQKSKENI